MNKILFMCFLAGVLALNGGCNWVDSEPGPAPAPAPDPTPPDPEAAGGILNIYDGVLAADGSSYTYVIDVYVTDADGNLVSGLNDFSVDNSETTVGTVTGKTSAVTEYFSSAILIDQSGSIIDADPFDFRIEAAKTFFSALSGNDNAALYVFAGNIASRKLPGDSIVSAYSDSFTQTLDEALVDTLKDLEGGDTPLFDSIYITLDLTAASAQNIYKSVIVLTDGVDDAVGGPTYGGLDGAIDYANTLGIKIHTIGLGNKTDQDTLTQLATTTGGAYIIAANAEQLEAVLKALNTLLSGGGAYYSVPITVTDVNAGLVAGDTLEGNILITLDDGSVVTIAYIVTIV